jgi:hypothetical protein
MATKYAAKELRRVAIHESAHAVFACLMEIPFSNVQVTLENKTRDSHGVISLGQFERSHYFDAGSENAMYAPSILPCVAAVKPA